MLENNSKTFHRRWKKPKQARSLTRVNRILDVAEHIFVEDGYAAATTKQIAAQAEVSIGSLYQFFPDKTAILQALAERYADLLNQRTQSFGTAELLQLPLPEYVKHLLEESNAFLEEHPGYRAIFMETITTLPETDAAADHQLIQTWAAILPNLNESFSTEDCEAIAFVLVKAMGNLLWSSLGQPPHLRQRLIVETERLTLSYLESYIPKQQN